MVLPNKLNITNQLELNRVEEKISKQKAKQLFESGEINHIEVDTFNGLAQIHAYLFFDLYDFAGKLRDVNIAKGNFRFAPLMYLEPSLAHISKMPQSNFEQVIDWNAVDKSDYLSAMERSVVKDIAIKYLLQQALTDKIDDREVFMKGIDISYYFEGYSEFNIEDL